MNANDFEYLLANPKLLGDKWLEILESTQGEEYNKARDRNDELGIMGCQISFVTSILPAEQAETIVKETLIAAYLLGRKDEGVPEQFRDLINGIKGE